jgi:uncharacterized membrane protein
MIKKIFELLNKTAESIIPKVLNNKLGSVLEKITQGKYEEIMMIIFPYFFLIYILLIVFIIVAYIRSPQPTGDDEDPGCSAIFLFIFFSFALFTYPLLLPWLAALIIILFISILLNAARDDYQKTIKK